MENIREHIYLAALLHDIGKFAQRADTGSVASSLFLKTIGKQESIFCPLYNGKYTHKHVLWTAQFIDDYNSVFKNLIGSDDTNLSDKNNLINLAACHHLSKNQLTEYGQIIKEADSLSSGMDRDSSDALKDEQDGDETGWNAFKKKRMTSILEFIKTDKKKAEYHLPIKKISIDKDFFPKKEYTEECDYATLWKDFIGEFKYIQANTYHAFSETFLYLLQKYATCIPASTINFPDVSLYDHLKTTAALAVCLYDWQTDGKKSDNPFLLIGADFSGIQNYIYQIVSEHAGKNLKGRSFYLRILSDTVVRYILKKLNLFQANIVYNSGGGFYILAPNTEYVHSTLPKLINELEEHFFKSHRTALYVAIDAIEMSKDDLMHNKRCSLGKVWDDLFKKRELKKQSKFANLINANYSNFFDTQKQGYNTKYDFITGEEIQNNEAVKFDNDGHYVSALNDRQIKLGEVLREMRYIVVSEEVLPYWDNITHISPADLGFNYYFLKSDELEAKAVQLKASADKVSVITLNGDKAECNFITTNVNGVNNIYGFTFYGGNHFNGKTFNKMCSQGEKEFSRLGVLRMDVDNLGSIFRDGIPRERATLSRYAALSRSLDYFFSGYLNTITEEIAPDKSFIVYSGGDDVFIVGSWDVAIRIAKRIHKDFSEYTCHNSAFSISGGIAIVEPKFPIMKAAAESEDEEARAKNHETNDNQTKNSISMMDMPLNWTKEFQSVESLKETILELINNDDMNKAFLSKISLLKEMAKIKVINLNGKEKHVITNMKTYWMLTYDIKRLKMRNDKCNTLLDNCVKEVCTNPGTLDGKDIKTEYHPLELWAFACRWAELEYRTNMK